ncbi:MAG: protease pro-enzyme activation domain-containing protein [Terracidiphilus sp.]
MPATLCSVRSTIIADVLPHVSNHVRKLRKPTLHFFILAGVLCVARNNASAQVGSTVSPGIAAPRPMITQPVDELQRTVLRGNTHPLARPAFDQGIAPANLPMQRMILVLKRSAEQESSLRELLDDQQTRTSPRYHQWLTPEQFGKQFGPADGDVETIEAWLESHGFMVSAVSKGRTAIEFSGTADQVREAFHTTIHKYGINGEQYWANSSDPSIPSALAPVVKGVLSLHNFPRRPQSTVQGKQTRVAPGPLVPSPLFTYTQGQNTYYGLGPTDFATIYNVLPLWNAGIDGTGQTIAIVGETNIHITDIEDFRKIFGLPAKDPQVILNGPDPGVVGDEPEAVLDVSWSGAVAKNATIDLVVSASTEASLGVDLSALYIVDNNLAPVMSESYGECEAVLGNGGNAFYNALWQQAAAQGISVVISAGDGGSAGCDDFNGEVAAQDGLAVSGFASTPYNVSVGGTDFDQTTSTAATYWSATNKAATGASALSYIPETTWNQSCAGMGIAQCTSSSNDLNILGGSGGPSSCSTLDNSGSCLSGYGKPSWQTGTGVPADGVRDQPDVSLFASVGFNGSFYIICEADFSPFGPLPGFQQVCSLTNNSFVGIGGTSASAPAFAGMMALVNQKVGAQGLESRQGNPNYILYKLAAQNGASCNSSTAAATGNSCIFYDITKGNDAVPCIAGTPNCGTGPPGGYGILVDSNGNPAWTTGPGYDLATGLGSVNANNLVNAWSTASFTPSTTALTNVSPVNLVHGQVVTVSATVAAKSGGGTPTGMVALIATPANQNLGIGDFALVNGQASGTTTLLPGGTYNVTAHYAGDSTFGASDSAPTQVTVGKENSQTTATLEAYNFSSGSFYSTNTTPYGSIFFLRSDVTRATGATCAPNPVQSQIACPTGLVSFNYNGKALDAGSYALNTQGYTEDQSLASEFTAVGSYALQAQYGGDNSYNPSSAALNAIVTQAPTNINYLEIQDLSVQCCSGNNYQAYSGQLFHIITTAYTQSTMPAPTGTIAYLENGNPAPGTVILTPLNGLYTGGFGEVEFAYLSGSLASSIDAPGNYTFTASYVGDSNYLGSKSPFPVNVTVVDTTFNIATPISNLTIAAPGQSGVASITLNGVDNFAGTINVSCSLPSAMKEATCPATSANLFGTATATAQLTITTTASHPLPGSRISAKNAYGFGVLACAFLFLLPKTGRRRFPLVVLLLVCIAGFTSCGGSSSGGGVQTDPGTPAGTYTVSITATSVGITRTGSFSLTVQ